MGYGFGWAPYVPLGTRLALAKVELSRLAKEGLVVQPIDEFKGKITRTFWGDRWLAHVESLQDNEFRLDRGKTYVRNGSVCHLAIEPGKVSALVAGSMPYNVEINVEKLKPSQWEAVKQKVVGQVDSLFDLLQGKISDEVMSQLADEQNGLFPKLSELSFKCVCPDAWGIENWMCKHIAAVFYGIGRRFETNPELLFTLRGVDCNELIDAGLKANLESHIAENVPVLQNDELENIFGIELAPEEEKNTCEKKSASKASVRKSAKKSQKPVSLKKTSKANDTNMGVDQPVVSKPDAVKTEALKKAPKKTKSTKTTFLSMMITASDREKIKKAADKSGLTRSAYIVARLKEFGKTDSDSNSSTRKLKRSRKNAKKDVQILIKMLPTEKKRVQRQAKRLNKSMSQFVYDVLFE